MWNDVVSSCLVEVTLLPPQPSLSHLALGLSVGTSALIAALLLAVSGVMISKYGSDSESATAALCCACLSKAFPVHVI